MITDIDSIWSAVVNKVEQETGIDCTRYRQAVFHMNSNFRAKDNIPVQTPNWMTIPGLAAKPYWSIDDFDIKLQRYLSRLENEFKVYEDEFNKNMENVEFGSGTATVYFGENEGWKAFLFYDEEARPVEGARYKFPKIAQILAEMRADNYIAKSHFSVLKSGGSIDVHCGGVNHELRMHYGIRVPKGDIGIKVGGETRQWENGKIVCFDDTFPHEVWNNTKFDRYILHCRLQHPGLTSNERAVSYLLDQYLTIELDKINIEREEDK